MSLMPAALTGGDLASVYLITGAEALLVERAVETLIARSLPLVEPRSFNASMVRCGESGADEALADARTPAMMAERRLVVVRDLQAGSDAFFGSLQEYLETPSDGTILVLAGHGFPAVRKGGRNWSALIGNRAKKAGVVVKFAARDVDPIAFAVAHAEELGHDLDRRAAALLVELVGRELGVVARAVEKTTLFAEPGAAMDGDVVAAACSAVAEADVWDLTSGIAARDADVALASLRRLLDGGTAPHQLLGLVGWQLRIVLKVSEAVRRKLPERDVEAAAGRMPRFKLRALRAAVGPNTPGAAEALERLARANRELNFVKADGAHVLQSLVLDLTDH